MSQVNDIYLGEASSEVLLSAFARTFTQGIIELSREERTASGRLVRDVIATKKTFTIAYEEITHTNLEVIATLYDLQDELSLIISYSDYTTSTFTVLLRPFNKERARAVNMNYWSGVELELNEV